MGDVIELRMGTGTRPVPAETLEEVIRLIDEALAKARPKPCLVYDAETCSAARKANGKRRKHPN